MEAVLNIKITKLERDEEGKWHCNVTVGGKTFPVHCKYGSWMYEDKRGMKDVLPFVAEAIQERVRPIEKRERIIREKAAKDAK